MTPAPDALVVGAGIAGLVAARELRREGLTIEVWEKSRGVGGRCATRTVHGSRVDHGAQFLTVRDPRFQREVAGWLADGTVVPWADGIATWTADGGWHHPDPNAHPRYACPAGMSALGKRLSAGTDVRLAARATAVRRETNGWALELEGGDVRRAPRLLITAPVPQALALLEGVDLPPAQLAELRSVAYAPCFAVMAGFDAPKPAWPAVRLPGHPDLAWVSHDASKRPDPERTVLVLHATADFSRRRYDDPPGEVTSDLLRAATALAPWADRPVWTDHQRWRFAQPERHHPRSVATIDGGLVLAGDGFGGAGGGRVEGAYVSGLAAAAALLAERAG